MEDFVVLVDEKNKKIGIEEKLKAHIEGKMHRAFSIFVFNSKNELLLQQRAKTKYHCPELWSNTCCSHPRPKEGYYEAAHRRLKEEMGFDCKLKKLFCFTYNTRFDNGLIENEYDCVFIGKSDKTPVLNKEEAMAYKWISIEEIEKDINEAPDKYTFWLKVALQKLKTIQQDSWFDSKLFKQ
jgi:isopentenyl-diphosphate Delta-isomerase